MDCLCKSYEPLKPHRKSINKRLQETKNILPTLEVIVEMPDSQEQLKLLGCHACGQLWQSSREWCVKGKEYVFQVPQISVDDWLHEPFILPATLMNYIIRMERFVSENMFNETERECRNEACENYAISMSAFCKQHHIEQLQNMRVLPRFPRGRLFPPYSDVLKRDVAANSLKLHHE